MPLFFRLVGLFLSWITLKLGGRLGNEPRKESLKFDAAPCSVFMLILLEFHSFDMIHVFMLGNIHTKAFRLVKVFRVFIKTEHVY